MLISEMEITGKAFDSLQEQNSALPLSLSLVLVVAAKLIAQLREQEALTLAVRSEKLRLDQKIVLIESERKIESAKLLSLQAESDKKVRICARSCLHLTSLENAFVTRAVESQTRARAELDRLTQLVRGSINAEPSSHFEQAG